MVAIVQACTLDGIDAVPVQVECEISRGLPGYSVVGLATTSVKEGAVRIRSALNTVGHDVPLKKVTINLAPADLRKPGSALDLPIALAVLIADAEHETTPLDNMLVLGELGLDGTVRPIHGVLAAALLARAKNMAGIVIPSACIAEAIVVDGIAVYGIDHLADLTTVLDGTNALKLASAGPPRPPPPRAHIDMSEVRGQAVARVAIEIAVAGGHNVLLAGPPGTGKTMLARRIPTILPPMTRDEALETTKIYSALGLANGLVSERPFRSPHHTISTAALLGGGTLPHPGEISLAHNGVLFLDEMPEFARNAIDALRQPLEERTVTISRIHGTLRLPASFLLVAAANPCPCGWLNSGVRECTCGPGSMERYRTRISGPLLDRIDLQVHVLPVPLGELRNAAPAESSAAIRDRVALARDRQHTRLAPFGVRSNAEMTTSVLRATCQLDARCEQTLAEIVGARISFTARSVDRMLKVARTIADLLDHDAIDPDCLYEAASFRDVDPTAPALCDLSSFVVDSPAPLAHAADSLIPTAQEMP